MLSCHAIGRPQAGQADAGRTTERRRGIRWMQTFRKEPTQAPTPTTSDQSTNDGMRATPPAPRQASGCRSLCSAAQDQAAPIADRALLRIVEVGPVLGIAWQVSQRAGRQKLLEPAGRSPFALAKATHGVRQLGDIHVHLEVV